MQGFVAGTHGAGTCVDMVLNTMAWSRCEVVALPDKPTESAGTDWQVDAAGKCLGMS